MTLTADQSDPPRIIVADDEQPILRAYEQVFSDGKDLDPLEAELFGDQPATSVMPRFDIRYCQQGEEVIRAVEEACQEGKPYGVAFLDVRMPPGVDGVEVARQIRALDPQINIVVVTGYSDLHPMEIARQVPPVEKLYYLAKPFHATEVQQFALALTSKWQSENDFAEIHRDLKEKLIELQRRGFDRAGLGEQAD